MIARGVIRVVCDDKGNVAATHDALHGGRNTDEQGVANCLLPADSARKEEAERVHHHLLQRTRRTVRAPDSTTICSTTDHTTEDGDSGWGGFTSLNLR